jgi:hypothetical protein
MDRAVSSVIVKVLDLRGLREEATEFAREKGKLDDGQSLKVGYTIGIVEKDGKHYVINTEGVGSTIPLEDEAIDVDWYAYSDSGFSMCPTVSSNMNFSDIAQLPVKDEVTLDKFIRKFGRRLEDNFREWEDFLLD